MAANVTGTGVRDTRRRLAPAARGSTLNASGVASNCSQLAVFIFFFVCLTGWLFLQAPYLTVNLGEGRGEFLSRCKLSGRFCGARGDGHMLETSCASLPPLVDVMPRKNNEKRTMKVKGQVSREPQSCKGRKKNLFLFYFIYF